MWRSGERRVANCFIGVLLGLAGLLVTVIPSLAQAPVAEAPTFQVGDEWRYTDGTVFRILAVEGDLIVTTSLTYPPQELCRDCRFYRDKNLTIIKVTDKNGKPEESEVVGFKTLDFPLQIGKQWTSNQKLKQRSSGRYLDYDNTFKVEGYEEVQTKAGTFKAFKVTQKQERRPYWSGQLTFWYSPEVKAVVKRQVPSAQWQNDRELESYTLK